MPLALALVFSLLVALTGCRQYEVSVNDRVLYTPRDPMADTEIADPALRDCLEQALRDAGVTTTGELRQLNCSHAGIERLDGIAAFTGLEWLDLDGNRIRNLVELGQLQGLTRVQLADNRVVDPVPMTSITGLGYLDLSGNAALQCPKTGAFPATARVLLPEHCPGGAR